MAGNSGLTSSVPGRHPTSRWATLLSRAFFSKACGITAFVVLGILLSTYLIMYAFFAHESLAPNAQDKAISKYFTWEIPDFAYMSNQVLLYATTPLYAPFPDRKLVPPGIYFPKIQGVNRAFILPVEQVYEMTDEMKQRYVLPTPTDLDFVDVNSMDEARSDRCKDAKAIRVRSHLEDFWAFEFYRYTVLGTLFHHPELVRTKRMLQFKEPIASIVRNATAAQNGRLKRAITVHLRTWEKSVTLNIKDVCARIPWFHPLKYWYACYTRFDYVSSLIDSVQTSSDQPIYIATDNKHHHVIKELQLKYRERIFFMDDVVDFSKVDYGDTQIPHHAIPAFVENELLAAGEVLLGNFWSTFTSVAGMKKGDRVYYFKDPATQATSTFAAMLLTFLVILAINRLVTYFLRDSSYAPLHSMDEV
jgi:hypothetical protein